jgi:hypothetical protein
MMRSEKWKRTGKSNLLVPKAVVIAAILCGTETAGFYPYMTMNQFAWIVKKRRKNDRTTKICPGK